jgi:iron only hydrogenase large subunit-like protein
MYSSIARKMISEVLGIPKEELFVVSVMPHTVKKYEARRTELVKTALWKLVLRNAINTKEQ